ncbi:MAG: XdhC family protein [Bacillota bacterium]|nr:XdhC family protein [Bacillota bacterium]
MSHLDEAVQMLARIEEAWNQGEKAALLVVTQVKGSSYRLPGAKMMMAEKGHMLGSLSGGCLEGDLFVWAEGAMKEDRPRLVQYDLTETELWTLGIGCKGTMEVAIFPIAPEDSFWRTVKEALSRGRDLTLILELPQGARALLEGPELLASDGEDLPLPLRERLAQGYTTGTRAEIIEQAGRRFYVDTMRPSQRLIICGAGLDTVPVASLAARAHFRVAILDPRPEFNSRARFPHADHLVMEPEEGDPEALRDSWWLIMNHFQRRDEAALRLALASRPRYVGVLGPLSRTQEMLQAIGETLESGPIRAPVGLALGAETFDEVAVSIVAELLMERTGASGKPLHGQPKIHA